MSMKSVVITLHGAFPDALSAPRMVDASVAPTAGVVMWAVQSADPSVLYFHSQSDLNDFNDAIRKVK